MNKILNLNLIFIIVLFLLMRFVDANIFLKGISFIFASILLIYLPQRRLNKINIFLLLGLLFIFTIFNEKKTIVEISGPLKINYDNENRYIDIFGSNKFEFIKDYFIDSLPECYRDTLSCFQNKNLEEIYISPDQIIFNSDRSFSRKLAEIKFSNLSDARIAFVNSFSGNINRHNIYKLETPYFVEYKNLTHLDTICFKGLAYIEPLNNKSYGINHSTFKCINSSLKTFTGFNLPNYNLEISATDKSLTKYFDDFILLIFLILILLNLHFVKINRKDLYLFISVLISTFIIFYISRFDLWFNVFNLFNFYFFGFEGGDGQHYINFTNILHISSLNFDLSSFLQGGEDLFYFTPGLRYFLLVNQLISGDFYYFYFFLLFFIPKIFFTYLRKQFGDKIGYVLIFSFLFIPFLHHLGFSYYQFMRHAYRIFPEPLGYMFFISGLTIFFHSFEKNYLKMNLLFALSVFLRPNLIVSIAVIMLLKTFLKRVNIFHPNYLIPLSLIAIIYLFPLMHNLYFGNSLILFTEYGSNMLSLDYISSKNLDFYINKYKLLNLIFMTPILIPRLNIYLKIILVTQYLTIFWFEPIGRYYWIYWLVSFNLFIDLVSRLNINRWKFLKKYISN